MLRLRSSVFSGVFIDGTSRDIADVLIEHVQSEDL
jgi:hypothetical protein